MFCPKCGQKNADDANFCTGCGAALGGGTEQSVVSTPVSSITARTFRCSGCGEPLKIPENARGVVVCPSCKTQCVIDGIVKNTEIAAKDNINSGIPLTATPAKLHSQIVSLFCESPTIPLDLFKKVEVVREERYCVSAFCFYCQGEVPFTFESEVITTQTVVRDNGEKSWEEQRHHSNWQPMSSSAAVTATVIAPGEKKLATQIQKLYTKMDSKKLIDISELVYPSDVITLGYNLPEPAAFTEYVKPYVEKLLQQKAEESIANKNTRSLELGGSKIQKDTVRVFLGLYDIVYKYDGKEYSLWLTGDAGESLSDMIPIDEQRPKELATKQKTKDDAVAAIEKPHNTAGLAFGLVSGIIAPIMLYGLVHGFYYIDTVLFFLFLIPGLALAIPCGIAFFKKWKVYYSKTDEVETEFQKEIDDFVGQLPLVKEQFKSQKKALRGIYENVTGDAAAF